jgi:regulator of sigma E protease
VARRSGVRVDEFGIGFPPRLFSWHRNGVTYSLNLLPLGGFVRIHGENGEGESDPDSFGAKRARTRAAILGAGVAMNWVTAFVAMAIALAIGVEASPDSSLGKWVHDSHAGIAGVEVGSPAHLAGLEPGASVLSVRGGKTSIDSPTANEFVAFTGIHASGTPLAITVATGDGESRVATVTPVFRPDLNRPAIGASVVDAGTAKLPIGSAIVEAGKYTVELTAHVAASLWGLVVKIFSREASVAELSGPVGIAILAREASSVGFGQLLAFAAAISVNLAVLNLLPLPALDGGRLVVIAAEKVARRKVPARWLSWVNLAGLALLLALMAAVTVSDIAKLI